MLFYVYTIKELLSKFPTAIVDYGSFGEYFEHDHFMIFTDNPWLGKIVQGEYSECENYIFLNGRYEMPVWSVKEIEEKI